MKTKLFKIGFDGESYHVASILREEETKQFFLDESGEESIDFITEVDKSEWKNIKIRMDENDDAGEPLMFTAAELVTEMSDNSPCETICSTVW